MYLKEGKEYACERKRGEDWHEIVGSSLNIMGLRFASLSLSVWLPVSLTSDPTFSVFVYLSETGAILLAREKVNVAGRKGMY